MYSFIWLWERNKERRQKGGTLEKMYTRSPVLVIRIIISIYTIKWKKNIEESGRKSNFCTVIWTKKAFFLSFRFLPRPLKRMQLEKEYGSKQRSKSKIKKILIFFRCALKRRSFSFSLRHSLLSSLFSRLSSLFCSSFPLNGILFV